MPFVNQQSDTPALAVLRGNSAINAAGSVASSFRAILRGESFITANLTALISGAATLQGESFITAHGRLNSEANVFGAAILEGEANITANSRLLQDNVAVLRGEANITATARILGQQTATLSLLIQIAPEVTDKFIKTYSARLFADSVAFPIQSFSYSEPSAGAGATLDLQLTKTSDRNALADASDFKFEIYDDGVWREIFATGKRSGEQFNIAFGDGRANDTLSISTIAPVAEKLELAPETDFILYDSARLTFNQEDFAKVYDTDGNPYNPTLRAVPNLKLHRALEILFVEKCGFSSVKTNLPNFNIRVVQAEMTQSYLDAIAPFVGVFNPLFFVRENVLWVLDSESSLPEGFASPFPLTANLYKSASFSENRQNADGFLVEFAENETDFDYFIERLEQPPPDESGTFGEPDFTETTTIRRFRDYYKTDAPQTPVKTEKVSEITEVHNGANLLSRETETYTFDSFSRPVRILKTSEARVPDIENDASVFEFSTVRRETTVFTYKPDIKNPRRQILASTIRQVRGLIAVDTQNQYLGEDFRQDFQTAHQAGNLTEGMTTEFAAIETETETAIIGKNGQIEVKRRVADHLRKTVVNSTTDSRAGDISLNGQTAAPKEIVVLRNGATRTNAKMQTLSVGELPLNLAVPLARRKLARRDLQSGNITLKGLILSLRRGTQIEMFDRENNSLGAYIVEGRSMSGANLGTREQQTTMNLEVKKL